MDGLVAGAAVGAVGFSARSYGQILGANDRLQVAIVGLNGRGYAHLSALKANARAARVSHVCDVEATILAKFRGEAERELGYAPAAVGDFRTVLAQKEVDAITIATPDHWHAPMAVLALRAGKHVYVEKPSSHNPREGELLVEAQKKYGRLVQVGDQQRSSPHTIRVIGQIHEGLIGRACFAKAWYVNTRKSMGIGKAAPVPAGLDWELWQGPAPRSDYKDNIQPYNWHWLTRYGTGEALNNGTHEVDVCRWAPGGGYAGANNGGGGGRYQFHDDWQFPDTMVTSFAYPDQAISWEGRSCNGMKVYGRDRGVTIHGTTGTVLIDRDGYEVYDAAGKKTDEFKTGQGEHDERPAEPGLDDGRAFCQLSGGHPDGRGRLHARARCDRGGEGERDDAAVVERGVDGAAGAAGGPRGTGHVVGDPAAMKLWGRTYEKGWEVRG